MNGGGCVGNAPGVVAAWAAPTSGENVEAERVLAEVDAELPDELLIDLQDLDVDHHFRPRLVVRVDDASR